MPPIRKTIYCTPFRMMRYSVILRSNQIRVTPSKRRLVDEENDVFIKRLGRGPVVDGPIRFRPKPYHLANRAAGRLRSEEHTSELQSREHLVCRLLLEKKKNSARWP